MKRILLLFAALLLAFSILAGCSNNAAEPSASAEPSAPSPTPSATGEAEEVPESAYPLVDTPVTFTCFWPLDVSDIADLAECQYFQEAAKVTNVYLEFQNPSGVQIGESFNLMVVSQDFPDMVKAFYSNYSQGIDNAIANGIVQPLEDYVEYLPNYMEKVNSNDQIKINCYSDAGHLWGINHIVSPRPQGPWAGPVVRKDMLDKIGYTKTPVTVDDWEEMLTLLKDNYPSLSAGPFQLVAHGSTSTCGTLTGAYGVHQTGQFLVKDKKVVYPVLEPGFKDYVTRMNSWWNKGLIYNDYVSEGFVYGVYSLATNDKIAVFDTIYNWLIVNYKNASTDPDFELKAVPLPRLNANEKTHVRQTNAWARTANSLCIMTSCKDIPLACRYWDFAFTEQGIVLGNWGVEGVTFNYDEEGNPKYTDLVKNYETGINSAMTRYVLFNAPGLCYWQRSYQVIDPVCVEACEIWDESADSEWVFPDGPVLTAEEGAEFSALFSDINTFVNENVNSFVMGLKPLSEYDAFIQQIKNMGINRCIEIKQASIDRYYNRLNIIGN